MIHSLEMFGHVGMIHLTNHHLWWGRSEAMIKFTQMWIYYTIDIYHMKKIYIYIFHTKVTKSTIYTVDIHHIDVTNRWCPLQALLPGFDQFLGRLTSLRKTDRAKTGWLGAWGRDCHGVKYLNICWNMQTCMWLN